MIRYPSRDVLLAAVLLGLGAWYAYHLSSRIPAEAYRIEALDTWFDNDLYKTVREMTDRYASPKSDRHPSFSLLTLPPTKLIIKATGASPLHAVLLVNAAVAGAWSALLFVLLRATGSRRPDAVLYALLGLGSATFTFLFTVAETFALGSVTILVCLLVAARDPDGHRSPLADVVVAAATLGVTVTNWMYGLLSALVRRGLRPAMEVGLASLGLVLLLWGAQALAFPDLSMFLGPRHDLEASTFVLPAEAGGPKRILPAFAVHPMVMPALQVIDRAGSGRWELLSVQASAPGSAGPWGATAAVLWVLVLGAGLAALFRPDAPPRWRGLLLAALALQLLLHLAYGYETFMYSPHWLPPLLVVAAGAARTRWRPMVLGVTLLCLACSLVNNHRQFDLAVGFLQGERDTAARRAAIVPPPARPEDEWGLVGPWVTGPGMKLWDPAAPEASGGGGLWPAPNAFYIGFVVQDGAGRVALASGDTGSARLEFQREESPPGEHVLRSVSPFYRAEWRSSRPRSWQLSLEVFPEANRQVTVVVRGVGWRFARIKSIAREGDTLVIDQRWEVRLEPGMPVVLGEERGPGWLAAPGQGDRIASSVGLGYARLGPLGPGRYRLVVEDARMGEGASQFRRWIAYGGPRAGE